MGTTASNYQAIFAITFQAIYSLFLLISPTSILLLFALCKTDTRYIDWIKYIVKYFLVLLLAYLLVIAVFLKGFSSSTIIFMAAIVVLLAFVIYVSRTKVSKEEPKKEEKKEVKKDTKKTNKK